MRSPYSEVLLPCSRTPRVGGMLKSIPSGQLQPAHSHTSISCIQLFNHYLINFIGNICTLLKTQRERNEKKLICFVSCLISTNTRWINSTVEPNPIYTAADSCNLTKQEPIYHTPLYLLSSAFFCNKWAVSVQNKQFFEKLNSSPWQSYIIAVRIQ
jgi:hypothetical protein